MNNGKQGRLENIMLSVDSDIVNKLKNKFHLEQFPEPFEGCPDAPIYILLENPGYDELSVLKDPDGIYSLKERQRVHMLYNLTHYKKRSANTNFSNEDFQKMKEFPMYNLDPYYKDLSSFKWWYDNLKPIIIGVYAISNELIKLDDLENSDLIDALNNWESFKERIEKSNLKNKKDAFKIKDGKLRKTLKRISKKIFVVDLIPYHSKTFSGLSSIVDNLRSSEYSRNLVKKAFYNGNENERKLIIIMKGSGDKIWGNIIKEYIKSNDKSDNVFKLSNPRNSTLSSNNLKPFRNGNEDGRKIYKDIVSRILVESSD